MAERILKHISEEQIHQIKKQLLLYRHNSQTNRLPAIFDIHNTSHCQQFVGARGGCSKEDRPKVVFTALKRRLSLAAVRYFLQRKKAEKLEEKKKAEDEEEEDREKTATTELLELSHLCHNRWCVNPHHLVRETHKANCERRHQCGSGKCNCELHQRTPKCLI